jgi:hypothetical protein
MTELLEEMKGNTNNLGAGNRRRAQFQTRVKICQLLIPKGKPLDLELFSWFDNWNLPVMYIQCYLEQEEGEMGEDLLNGWKGFFQGDESVLKLEVHTCWNKTTKLHTSKQLKYEY